MKLNIVTACSRPENLYTMLPDIEECASLIDNVEWHIVFDLSCCEPVYVPGAKTYGISLPESRYGMGQRNLALDKIDDGWVYFLDDDNLINPELCTRIMSALREDRSKRAFAFHQSLAGNNVRYANPKNMRVGYVDMAQVCIMRDFIGDARFELPKYEADGIFIERLYNHNPSAWGFIDKVLCFYNALR